MKTLPHIAVGAFDHYFTAVVTKLMEPAEGSTADTIKNKDARKAIIDKAGTMASEMVAARLALVERPGVQPEPDEKE